MRDLRRNQTQFWYSLYLRKEPVLESGFETGQYEAVYSEPVLARAHISSASGESEAEMFGADVQYDRVISTVQNLPINEFSRLWIDADPATGAAHDYVVKRVAPGLTQNLWAVARVV